MNSNEIFDPHLILLKLRNSSSSSSSNNNNNNYLSSSSSHLKGPPPYPDKSNESLLLLSEDKQRNDLILEMESEIKELSLEVLRLKNVNKQILNEKKTLENQLNEQKEKSDDIIAKLRNHIVSLNKQLNSFKSNSINGDYNKKKSNPTSTTRRKQVTQEYSNPVNKSFSGPTFSEVMRRKTLDPKNFSESLRKDTTITNTNLSSAIVSTSPTSNRILSHGVQDDFIPLPPPYTHYSVGDENHQIHEEVSQSISPPYQRKTSTIFQSPNKDNKDLLMRTQSLSSQNGERRNGFGNSLQRAFSFGNTDPGILSNQQPIHHDQHHNQHHNENDNDNQYLDEQGVSDEDDDLPVVDIDLRY